MPLANFNNVNITNIHCTVGNIVRYLDDEKSLFEDNPGQMDRIRKAIGLNKRNIVNKSTTALDLCKQSAFSLIRKGDLKPEEIDALILLLKHLTIFNPPMLASFKGPRFVKHSAALI